VTVNARPAIVSVPVRAAPVLAAIVKFVLPLPVPDAPLVIVIHGTLLVAVQAHAGTDAVTVVEPVAPVSGTVWLAGEMVNVHAVGGAAWFTVNV
jgi:hypothetical protein